MEKDRRWGGELIIGKSERSSPGSLQVMDLWVLREQLPGNPVRAIEPASGRVGLEAGPRGRKVALGTTRVCELGPLSHHLFQGLFSPLVCALVDLSPQHSF